MSIINTLSITKIRRQPYFSVVTICEIHPSGERDGFEDVRVLHRDLDASDDDAGDIDAALAAIARERGVCYE